LRCIAFFQRILTWGGQAGRRHFRRLRYPPGLTRHLTWRSQTAILPWDYLASYHCSAVNIHREQQRQAWRHSSATQYFYGRQRSCNRAGNANLGELYNAFRPGCGSVLLCSASPISERKRRFFLALCTEARNAFPSWFYRSSELDTRSILGARLAAGRHRHHWPGTV
jgi:hypothetical protein